MLFKNKGREGQRNAEELFQIKETKDVQQLNAVGDSGLDPEPEKKQPSKTLREQLTKLEYGLCIRK